MKISVWQRHYVKDSQSLAELKGIVNRTLHANNKRDYSFYVLLHYSPNIEDAIKKEVATELRKLLYKNVLVILSKGYGPGGAWLISMFNSFSLVNMSLCKNTHVNFLIDGDQFEVNRSEVLDSISLLSESLSKGRKLIGLGARDKVILSTDPKMDNARKIAEMYHVKFINKIKLENPLSIDLDDVPESYRNYGDPIPGFYSINLQHLGYLRLYECVFKACKVANLTGYVGDPYSVMRASLLTSEIPSIYVPIKGNPPGEFKSRTIKEKSIELGKTDIGKTFFEVVKNEPIENDLSVFYPKEQVKQVKEEMLEGLKEGLNFSRNYFLKANLLDGGSKHASSRFFK